MSEQKKITVVLNCYNSEKYLEETIKSVLAQTYKSYKILFIDNCSTDKSALIAQSFGSVVNYVKTPYFMKLYEARNFALNLVDTDYLAFLDCDDSWLPDKLENQLRIMEENKGDFSYTRCSYLVSGNSTKKSFFFSMKQLFRHTYLRFFPLIQVKDIYQLLRFYDISLESLIVKTSIFKKSKFNSKLNLMGDFDIIIRSLLEQKIRVVHINRVYSKRRLHPAQLTLKSWRNWLIEARYLYLFSYKKFYNVPIIDSLVMNILSFYRYMYYKELRDNKRLKETINRSKFINIRWFLRWLHYQLE